MCASQKVYVVVKNRKAKVDRVSQCVKAFVVVKGVACAVGLVARVSVIGKWSIQKRVASSFLSKRRLCIGSML